MNLRSELEVGTERFFLSVNQNANTLNEFFKRQYLDIHSFSRMFKDVCSTEGIAGSGSKGWITTHGLQSEYSIQILHI